ncbi:oligosaccharide flippase family protein [Thalassoglobus sp.]|uniref:oligosaccharide flippase family protein n=1 Tax=Thalassoglobus sp. TaxID=2795869 RepID=UPI003AA8A68C
MTLRKNILAGWAAHLVTVMIGFFLMPYILGTVGESQYGAWVFINAVAGYSGMIYGGFGATICRYVSDLSARKEWTRLNQFVSSIQSVYFVTAIIALLVTACFAWGAGSLNKWDSLSLMEIRLSILIVGGTIALGMIGSVYGGVLIGMQRLDIKRSIEVGIGITRLVLVLLCLQQQYGLITLALIFLAVTLAEHLISAVIAYRLIPTLSIAPWNTRKDVLQECFGFSAFNAIALVAEYLIFFTDTVVIGLILGPIAVVPYQIGLRIAQMIQIPIAQIGEAILPKAGELHAKQGSHELGKIVAKGMGVAFLLSGGFFIGATYFGEMLIQTWIGKHYPSSALVMAILVGAQMVALPMVVTRKALLGTGQVRLPAFIDIAEAAFNLILSLILIQYWGIVGVAIGTLIPIVLIELFVFLPYATKQLYLDRRNLFHQAVVLQTPALIGLLVFCELISRYELSPGWLQLLAVTAGGGIVLLGMRYLTHILDRNRPPLTTIYPKTATH